MKPAPIEHKFAAWRLRIRSATDGELVAAVEWLQRAQIVFAAFVLFGAALDVVLTVLHPAYGSSAGVWGAAVVIAAVAPGVLAVLVTTTRLILYQSELTSRANRRVSLAARMAGEAAERAANANSRAAEANERARNAELALEQAKAAHEPLK